MVTEERNPNTLPANETRTENSYCLGQPSEICMYVDSDSDDLYSLFQVHVVHESTSTSIIHGIFRATRLMVERLLVFASDRNDNIFSSFISEDGTDELVNSQCVADRTSAPFSISVPRMEGRVSNSPRLTELVRQRVILIKFVGVNSKIVDIQGQTIIGVTFEKCIPVQNLS